MTIQFVRSLARGVHSSARAAWNSRRERTKLAVIAIPLAAGAMSVFAARAVPTQSWNNDGDEVSTFTVDVAESLVRYAQNDVEPPEGQILFSPGDTFILEGTIYPGGTLPRGKANNDPEASGGIGRYRARGVYTIEPADFENAVENRPDAPPELGLATEIFSFHEDGTSIFTDGIWPNAHHSARRLVLGGTGRFRYTIGEIKEENIGENKTGFCNLRITFLVKRLR